MKVTFLGTGTSHGVPSVDCMIANYSTCPKGVCEESVSDKKHCRSRCSILVEYDGKKVLIDVSSDFRMQVLREKIPVIDAVLITHKHADHIMGIPDIRSYNRGRKEPLPFFGSAESINGIKKTFEYIFQPPEELGGGIPSIECVEITGSFSLFDKLIIPIPVTHGSLKGCLGFRIGDMAYIPDLKIIPEKYLYLLNNLDCLIIDCLRETENHSTHITLPDVVSLVTKINPKRCYFTHMSHDIHYKKDKSKIEEWMEFAWDGLCINI